MKKTKILKKSKYTYIFILAILLTILFIYLYFRTGFLQPNKIDKRDLEYWEYENGFIKDNQEITIQGNNQTCWLLIHSYCATPKEMEELAFRIHSEFGDYIYVPLLEGHGQIPSKIINLSLEDWYLQIEKDYEKLSLSCSKINVVGSSYGGALATNLAKEKEFKNLYLVNPFIEFPYKFYYLLPLEKYINLFSKTTHYSKKVQLAQINSKQGLEEHIAYWNMPYLPVKNSKIFLENIRTNLTKINENVLIQHSENDKVASINGAKNLFEKAQSINKKIIQFNKSNHVLLKDFEKNEVIENIIKFEKEFR